MASTRNRALFVAPATPARTGNGLAMRLALFHDALSAVADVTLAVVHAWGPRPDDAFSTAFAGDVVVVEADGRTDTQYALLSRISDPAERLRQFRRYGRSMRCSVFSVPVVSELRACAEAGQFDLVHVGRLGAAEALVSVGASAARTLDLDEDDPWATRLAAGLHKGWRRDWLLADADADDALLRRVSRGFDGWFISGPSDAATLAGRHPDLPVEIVPNAIEFPRSPNRMDDGRTVMFIGSFGYEPNVAGVLWFAREVWPRVVRRAKNRPRFRIFGRDVPQAIQALDGRDHIEVVGAVEHVATAYAPATLAVAPLHAGGGTRIKLIEAAAHATPVVSTRLAARGLGFADPSAMWLADDAATFAGAVLAALADASERQRRADIALRMARAEHEWGGVVDRLACRFEAILASKRQA